jgi:excisionase family DNA binding protein
VKTADLPPVLTITEVAPILRVHFDTAYRQIKNGTFPVRVIKIGNRHKVLRSDLERFLAGELAAS